MKLNERLIKAREHAGLATVADAATFLGIPYPTYAGHENGSSGFRRDSAAHYARRFGVSLDWLITGRGSMTGPGLDPREAEYLDLFRDAPDEVRQSVLTILRHSGKP